MTNKVKGYYGRIGVIFGKRCNCRFQETAALYKTDRPYSGVEAF